MKKLLLVFIILILTSCAPNEADFRSNIPYSGSSCGPNSGPNCCPNCDIQLFDQRLEPQQEINWNVPFFPQAPDADWSLPWQEACEEAASILAYYYASGKTLTKDQFKQEIQNLVEWQNKNFGDYKHTDITETAKMIRGYFKFTDLKVVESPTIDQMKQSLSKGQIIIAPFAGRQLKNPFYSGEGPLYHMMVIKGYDQKHFITNDVGTKRGRNFIYPYQTIMSAMHEWHNKDINLGAKKIIVFKR